MRNQFIFIIAFVLIVFVLASCQPEVDVFTTDTNFDFDLDIDDSSSEQASSQSSEESSSPAPEGSSEESSSPSTEESSSPAPALTDEEFFKTVCLATGNKWVRSGGLDFTSPVAYKKYFNSDGSVTAISLSSSGSVYLVSDFNGVYATSLYMTVNEDWKTGFINTSAGKDSTKLAFTLDREAKTITVTKDSKTVVFTLSTEV